MASGAALLQRIVQPLQQRPALRVQRLAGVGQADLAGRAHEQGGAQRGFEAADLQADLGLGDAQMRGRGGKAALARHRIEEDQGVQVEA